MAVPSSAQPGIFIFLIIAFFPYEYKLGFPGKS